MHRSLWPIDAPDSRLPGPDAVASIGDRAWDGSTEAREVGRIGHKRPTVIVPSISVPGNAATRQLQGGELLGARQRNRAVQRPSGPYQGSSPFEAE